MFCIPCRSTICAHVQGPPVYFTPRELSILRSLADPTMRDTQHIADGLGIAAATLKVTLSRMYKKLGWESGSMRLLTIWVYAHAADIGVPLPTAADFAE